MLKKLVILLIIVILAVGAYKYFCHPHYAKLNQRIVVLGFDGMDPTLTEKYMAEGKLPNLAALAKEGTYCHLSTTNPAESPVSWASVRANIDKCTPSEKISVENIHAQNGPA